MDKAASNSNKILCCRDVMGVLMFVLSEFERSPRERMPW